MRKGIDVSVWDPKMDWSQYTWDFAFIKVSEGTVIDPMFDVHWANARGRTKRAGYHFFRAFVDPKLAVQRFVTYLGLDEGELPPALDLEDIDDVDVKTSVSRALTWLLEYEKITGIKPIIYSSPSFINDVLKLHLYPDFSDYELWLATYPYDNYSIATRGITIHNTLLDPSTLIIPATPKPFKRIKYYQWTAKGSPSDVPGYYTGSGGKLAVDFNFQLDETEPGPGGSDMNTGRVQGASNTTPANKPRNSKGNINGLDGKSKALSLSNACIAQTGNALPFGLTYTSRPQKHFFMLHLYYYIPTRSDFLPK